MATGGAQGHALAPAAWRRLHPYERFFSSYFGFRAVVAAGLFARRFYTHFLLEFDRKRKFYFRPKAETETESR